VVDDGSELKIKKTSIFNDPRVTLMEHEQNLGANAARNTGFNHSKGKWISFLDSDDTWSSNKIEVLVKALESKYEYQVAYSSFKNMINGKTESIFEAKYNGNIYTELLSENVVGSASVPIISRSVIEDVSGFDEALKSAQDWDLWLRIAEKGYLFLAISKPLMNYTMPLSKHHISNSDAAFWDGRRAFLKKHKSKYSGSNRQILGKVYSDIGFLFLNRFGSRFKALSCFINAVISNPKRAKSWKGLLAVFLPTTFLSYSINNKD
jgi:glycosyltransferase involved in cell wall biosynthesis